MTRFEGADCRQLRRQGLEMGAPSERSLPACLGTIIAPSVLRGGPGDGLGGRAIGDRGAAADGVGTQTRPVSALRLRPRPVGPNSLVLRLTNGIQTSGIAGEGARPGKPRAVETGPHR